MARWTHRLAFCIADLQPNRFWNTAPKSRLRVLHLAKDLHALVSHLRHATGFTKEPPRSETGSAQSGNLLPPHGLKEKTYAARLGGHAAQ